MSDPTLTRRGVLHGAAAGLLLGLAPMPGLAAEGPVADTANGRIRGVANGAAQIYRGIPYGAPTGGANRFKAPVKPESWSGVRDAVEYGQRSPQATMAAMPEEQVSVDQGPMSEDCLRLNVWTTSSQGKRPVMVWFHGGGFVVGSGSNRRYDGSNLATKHGVVVVTINHRLGVLGFLDLAGAGVAGYPDAANAGMLDCVAALEWVRDNIRHFGGDAGNVTIFGESGGGAKVCTLMAMPAAKGLFHRAIVESGMSLRAIAADDAAKSATGVLGALGVAATDAGSLQTLPVDRLLEAGKAGGRLGPVVDGRILPVNPFDPAAPALSADVPMIIGTNETEATFFPTTPLDPISDTELTTRVRAALHLPDDEAATRIIGLYHAGRPSYDNVELLQVLLSDMMMGLDASLGAERKAALGRASAYLYHFEKTTPVRGGKLHTPHTLEIPYVFDNVDLAREVTGDGPERQALADKMSGAWTRFAHTGNPNGAGLPSWPAYAASHRAVMIFDDTCRVTLDPHEPERAALLASRGTLK